MFVMKESVMKEILQEYDLIQREEEIALQRRRQEVADKIPEIIQLHRTIIEKMAEQSRKIIQNPNESVDSIRHLQMKIADLKAREIQLLIDNGFPADYLAIRYRCDRCRDTGYVGFPVREKCNCLIQKLLARTYLLSNIHELEYENFDTFDSSIFSDSPEPDSKMSQRQYMEELKERLEEYVCRFPDNDRKIILFTGKTGLGKTFLLNCMAKAILDKSYTVIRISAYKLFDQLFHSALTDQEEYESLQRQLFDVDTLIIDDLGTETRRNNFTSEDLFNIINERSILSKHTFLSTNLGLNELRQRYSDRITSRLFDTSNTMLIRFKGQDVRLRRRNNFKNETRQNS
jgi:DNA replication protein DnaC